MRWITPLLALCALVACRSAPPEVPLLATARLAEDFDTYALTRVGLVPVESSARTDQEQPEQLVALEDALYTEFARSMAQELVLLRASDLAEIPTSEPLRFGHYEPQTLIQLARRFRLDALLFVQVTQRRTYPPQQLSLNAELVGVDTGSVIWTARVHLDASDERVREGLRAFHFTTWKELESGGDWRLALLSPSRFAAFGAWQLARLL